MNPQNFNLYSVEKERSMDLNASHKANFDSYREVIGGFDTQ